MSIPTSRVSRVLIVGPLAPFAEQYRERLRERGYTLRTVVSLERQAAHLSRWLRAEGLGVETLSETTVDAFVSFLLAGDGFSPSRLSRPGLRCLLVLLRELGVVPAPVPLPLSPVEVLMGSFERYLLSERGLVAGTVVGYVAAASWFVTGLGSGALGDVGAAEVTAAVLSRSGMVSVSGTQNFVSGLRAFLRFCFVEGHLEVDLSEAALPVTGRRHTSLPLGIPAGDAAALLGSCDRRTGLGRRDYALLIVMLRLGLRRSEVAGLRLDDIDWRSGVLVVAGKGDRRDRLPLPADVGDAIAGYLTRGRPATVHREVFIRAKAPFEPIADGTVASTVRRACRRAGVAEVGSHRLRHTMACDMVTALVPLAEIAQVLRHDSLQSTAIYARVDVETLRLLAQPWPEGGAR
ncbi:site-specific integrase [Candidatus Microthrix parvicella]|uniref:site-specific integrase n=1 Tax=Candidatus Neomicrothrix parvicella TaxID=41950 RepID=UPI000C1FA63D|nr:site-specific integrase [Candidatus Microthrix parvicella]